MKSGVTGIGNPLIDILVEVSDEDLDRLGLHKGTMHLIDADRRGRLIEFLASRPKELNCGGSCPNTIITIASFGVPASLGGKVGDDEYGEFYRTRLKELGVTDLITIGSEPTGSSIILISPDSERTMNTFLGANRQFSSQDIDSTRIEESAYLHLTGYMWDTASQREAIMTAIAIAEQAGTAISFDIADPFAVSRNRDTFLRLIADHASIVFANNEEARILFDNYDAYECARSMGKLCPTAIVKNGRFGSFISEHGVIESVPVLGGQAVDTTGAGDIYAAGFLIGRCRGYDVRDCGILASYLAGEIIAIHGAQFSLQDIERISECLADGSWRSGL